MVKAKAQCVTKGCKRKPHVSKKGRRFKYCRQHWIEICRVNGSKHGNSQKHDRTVDKGGYVWVRVDGRLVPEHRHVMEQILDRPLRKGESVHHINGFRDDNKPENLELWLTPIRYGQRATEIICPHCGKAYQ